jgi:hypothetical protein
MSKAVSIPITSRRSLIAGAAALPASAIPIPAMADNADAELLANGRRLRDCMCRERAALLEVRRLTPILEEQLTKTEIPKNKHRKYWGALERISRETGHRQAFDTWNEHADATRALIYQICRTEARSFAGLLVQIEAIVWDAVSGHLDAIDDQGFPTIEWDDGLLLDAIMSLFARGGQPVPAFIAETRQLVAEALEHRRKLNGPDDDAA